MGNRPSTFSIVFSIVMIIIVGGLSWIKSDGLPNLLRIALAVVVAAICWFGSQGLSRIGKNNGERLAIWLSKKTTVKDSTADAEMYIGSVDRILEDIDPKELAKLRKDPIFKRLITQYEGEKDELTKAKYLEELVNYIHTRVL
jgi:hypothetical protein